MLEQYNFDPSIIFPRGVSQLEAMILDIKQALSNTDYMVTKCQEAIYKNKPLPYDFDLLIEKRDSWRQLISELEEEVKQMKILEEQQSEEQQSEEQ